MHQLIFEECLTSSHFKVHSLKPPTSSQLMLHWLQLANTAMQTQAIEFIVKSTV